MSIVGTQQNRLAHSFFTAEKNLYIALASFRNCVILSSGCYNRTNRGATYIGPVSFSATGKRCRKWHDHPDNNCRNPYGEKDRPWCHTRAGREYCAIEICGKYISLGNEDGSFQK